MWEQYKEVVPRDRRNKRVPAGALHPTLNPWGMASFLSILFSVWARWRQSHSILPFYRWEDWGLKRASKLCNVILLVGDRVGTVFSSTLYALLLGHGFSLCLEGVSTPNHAEHVVITSDTPGNSSTASICGRNWNCDLKQKYNWKRKCGHQNKFKLSPLGAKLRQKPPQEVASKPWALAP